MLTYQRLLTLKKLRAFPFAVGVFLLWLCPHVSLAQIVVNEALHTVDGNKPALRQITLKNVGGKGTLAVKTEVVEVLNFGSGEPEKTKISKDFFITPAFLSLGEGYSRQIKFIWNGKGGESDRFFRLRFIPSFHSDIEEDGSTTEVPDQMKPHVGVTYGSGILVTVLPKEPFPSLKFNRTTDTIEFENDGNTFSMLKPLPHGTPKRLLAGEKWVYQVPSGMKFEDIPFERTVTGEKVTLTIPYVY